MCVWVCAGRVSVSASCHVCAVVSPPRVERPLTDPPRGRARRPSPCLVLESTSPPPPPLPRAWAWHGRVAAPRGPRPAPGGLAPAVRSPRALPESWSELGIPTTQHSFRILGALSNISKLSNKRTVQTVIAHLYKV